MVWSLRRFVLRRFKLLGRQIGTHPLASIALSLLLATPALLGLLLLHQPTFELDEGFVAGDAPSRQEIAAQKEFFGAKGEPWYLALFGKAKSNPTNGAPRSMLSEEAFNEFNSFYQKLLRMELVTSSGQKFRYSDICAPLCDINDPMIKLMENAWLADFRYPVSRVQFFDIDVNIGKHLFNRTEDAEGKLKTVGTLAFYFTAFTEDAERKHQFDVFEKAVNKLVDEHNGRGNGTVLLVSHGSGKVSGEMQRGIMESGTLILAGLLTGSACFGVLFHWTVIGVMGSQLWGIGRSLAIVSCCSAIWLISLPLGIGLLNMFQARNTHLNALLFITSPALTMLFLLTSYFSIQLTTAFLRAWEKRQRIPLLPSAKVGDLLGEVFLHCGHTFIWSHISTIFALLLGAYFATPLNYKNFALGLAGAVFHNTIFLIFLLPGVLVLLFPTKTSTKTNGKAPPPSPPLLRTPPGSPSLTRPSTAEDNQKCCLVVHVEQNGRTKVEPTENGTDLYYTNGVIPNRQKRKNGHIENTEKNFWKNDLKIDLIETALSGDGEKTVKTESSSTPTDFSSCFSSTSSKSSKVGRRTGSRRRQKSTEGGKSATSENTCLSSLMLSITLVLSVVALACLGAKGFWELEASMDYRRLLPGDSGAAGGFQIMDSVWNDFLHVLYIVRRPPNFENPIEFQLFTAMPTNTHMSWLFDYYTNKLGSDFFIIQKKTFDEEELFLLPKVNMSQFNAFISGFPFEAWKSGVKFDYAEDDVSREHPRIREMLVMVAYNGTRELVGKQRLINACRKVAQHFPYFDVVVFDTDSRTVDIMDAIWPLFTTLMVTAVCGILPGRILITSACTAATVLMLVGLAAQLPPLFYLDLLTVPSIFVIALSAIHFGTAQVSVEFDAGQKKCPPLGEVASGIGLSLTKGCFLPWLFLTVPQLFTSVPYFAVLARLQLLAVVISAFVAMGFAPSLMLLFERLQQAIYSKCKNKNAKNGGTSV